MPIFKRPHRIGEFDTVKPCFAMHICGCFKRPDKGTVASGIYRDIIRACFMEHAPGIVRDFVEALVAANGSYPDKVNIRVPYSQQDSNSIIVPRVAVKYDPFCQLCLPLRCQS